MEAGGIRWRDDVKECRERCLKLGWGTAGGQCQNLVQWKLSGIFPESDSSKCNPIMGDSELGPAIFYNQARL